MDSPFASWFRFSLSSCSTDEKTTSFFMSTTVLETLCNFLSFLIGSGSQIRKETQRQTNPIIKMRAKVTRTTQYDYSLRNNSSDLYSDLETVNKHLRISSTLVEFFFKSTSFPSVSSHVSKPMCVHNCSWLQLSDQFENKQSILVAVSTAVPPPSFVQSELKRAM